MTQQSPVIDVHAHIVFEALHGAAGLYGPEAGVDEHGVDYFRIGEYELKPLSYAGSVFVDMALRLQHMDRLGIDVQVLSANPLTMHHFGAPGCGLTKVGQCSRGACWHKQMDRQGQAI
jgi:aminocarboxymuconate-semialdehyde decarboxylase